MSDRFRSVLLPSTMAIEFDCPACDATIRVKDNAAGKKGRCPKCKRILPQHSKFCPACLDRKQVAKRLAGYFAPYKWQTAGIVVMMLLPTSKKLMISAANVSSFLPL